MTSEQMVYLVILGSAIVTWVPRILPFVFVSERPLPPLVSLWLSFIPVCIFTALIVDALILQRDGSVYLDWRACLAIGPTLLVAWCTKSLTWTVVIGVVTIAILRLI